MSSDKIKKNNNVQPSGSSQNQLQLQQIQQTVFSGPLPPPTVLEHYNKILPGSAERILAMAEKQAEHRRTLEKFMIEHNTTQSGRGQLFGFILGVIGLISAAICILSGQPWGGVGIGGVTLASLVSVFVIGKKREVAELKEKQ